MKRTILFAATLALLAGAGPLPPRAAAQEVEAELARVPRIEMTVFRKQWDAKAVVVVDVRSPEVYKEGHIPGALNIPTADVSLRVDYLKSFGKPIVTYCS